MNKMYRSKIDLALVIPLAVLLIAIEIFLVVTKLWFAAIITALEIVFIAYLFADTSYSLTEDNKLTIKCGFLVNKVIAVASIKRLEPTRDPAASPALSLDRLRVIVDKKDSILISPKDKGGFIRDLKTVNPAIVVDDTLH